MKCPLLAHNRRNEARMAPPVYLLGRNGLCVAFWLCVAYRATSDVLSDFALFSYFPLPFSRPVVYCKCNGYEPKTNQHYKRQDR